MQASRVVALWPFVILWLLAGVSPHLVAQSSSSATATQPWQPPRTPDGKPDLQGTWTNNTQRLFEYACHEANYSMAGALRGARAQEKDQKPDR